MPSVTISINDSARIATQQATDSLTLNSGTFEGLALPSNPHAESWVFGVLISLFLILVVAFGRSPAWIMESVKKMTRNRRDTGLFSGSNVHEFQSRLLLTVFTTGTVTLFLYSEMFVVNRFSFATWFILLLISGAYLILKDIFAGLTGFVFLLAEEVKKAKIYFYSLYSFLGILAFPILVLKLYLNTPGQGAVFSFILLLIALILLLLFIVLLFQIFYRKILDFFYILLYLCTLEFLPLAGLFLAFRLFLEK
jgi:hypothetical protein